MANLSGALQADLKALRKPTLIEFRWGPNWDNELDFIEYASLTPEQIKEVEGLLNCAEQQGIVDRGWYVGPFDEHPKDGAQFLEELKTTLDLGYAEDEEGEA